jgi:DNA-binding transcriptional LysR family regulator
VRYTLRQLSYFVAAGETGSITQASERVNISQPSISAAILHLEREFGVQLFVRQHAQGLALTPVGARFLQSAKTVLRSAHELYDVANEAARSVSGPIHVGSFRTYAPLLIPELCRTFLEKHPRVDLHVTEGSEASLLEQLRNAKVDVAITYEMHLTSDIAFEPLAELPTYALVPADHPFARQASVRLEDLCEEPFILLDLPLSREYFLGLFARAGLSPKIAFRTPSPETLRSLVGSGFGLSLMTARPVNKRAANGKRLQYVPLDGPNPPMVLGLASLRGIRKTLLHETFEAHCRGMISTVRLPGMAALQRSVRLGKLDPANQEN